MSHLATAVDDLAAAAEALVLLADQAGEDRDASRRLPAMTRVLAKLLQQGLTDLANQLDGAEEPPGRTASSRIKDARHGRRPPR